jgi:hypothetical protein
LTFFPAGNLLELHAELQLPLAALLPLLALLVERAVEVQKDKGENGNISMYSDVVYEYTIS